MRELNEVGLEDPLVDTSEHNKTALNRTLRLIVEDAARESGDKALQYTELGPEPSKTKFILRNLLENGVDVRRYCGVDINPTSKDRMEREIAELLSRERIRYRIELFEDLGGSDFRMPGTRNLVTMLGFEEGNQHPRKIQGTLDAILGAGDLLLSEMQLLPKGDWSPIFNFYQSDKMRRFSKIAFRRAHPDLKSEYGVYLVPITLADLGPLMVAVTAEEVVDDRGPRGKIFVTNYCLKYTREDYVRVREAPGNLKVLAQRVTGDGSVAFQLSEKA